MRKPAGRHPSGQTPHTQRGSKYPIFKDSGLNSHSGYGFWDQNPVNIGYLDPRGDMHKPRKTDCKNSAGSPQSHVLEAFVSRSQIWTPKVCSIVAWGSLERCSTMIFCVIGGKSKHRAQSCAQRCAAQDKNSWTAALQDHIPRAWRPLTTTHLIGPQFGPILASSLSRRG